MSSFRGVCIALVLLALLGLGASAQNYSIRVQYNTNIRAQPSLSGQRLETVAAGTVLEVLAEFNKWLKVNRGGDAWMAGWVSHERVAGGQPSAAVDNCCGIDRQCQQDSEWVAGYWAFQRGQCQASVATAPTNASQPSAGIVSDNCCGIDRQCRTDDEWTAGYWAFQRGQCGAASQPAASTGNCCDSGWNCGREHDWIYGAWAARHNRCFPRPDSLPPQPFGPYANHGHVAIIELTPGFATMVNDGFELLRTETPIYYSYVVNAVTQVREVHCCGSGVYGASGIVDYHHGPFSATKRYKRQDAYTTAELLVHEACHVYQDREGRGVGGEHGWLNEYECQLFTLDSAMRLGGVSQNIYGWRAFLADPMNRAHWWW